MLLLASNSSISGPFSLFQSNASRVFLFSQLRQTVFPCVNCENIFSRFTFEKKPSEEFLLSSKAYNILWKYTCFDTPVFHISRYNEFGLIWIRGIVYPFKTSHSLRSLSAFHNPFFSNWLKCYERLLIPISPSNFRHWVRLKTSKILTKCLKMEELNISENLSFLESVILNYLFET